MTKKKNGEWLFKHGGAPSSVRWCFFSLSARCEDVWLVCKCDTNSRAILKSKCICKISILYWNCHKISTTSEWWYHWAISAVNDVNIWGRMWIWRGENATSLWLAFVYYLCDGFFFCFFCFLSNAVLDKFEYFGLIRTICRVLWMTPWAEPPRWGHTNETKSKRTWMLKTPNRIYFSLRCLR